MVISIAGILMILVIAVAIGCLFNRRARTVGLSILGLFVCGLFFFKLVAVSHQSSTVYFPPHQEIYRADNVLVESLPGYDEQLRAEASAEILKNQRMAAQMDDAYVQKSPDGSTLETYPDGMQIRQRWPDGFRSIVRASNGGNHSLGGGLSESSSFRTDLSFFVLGAPLLALLAAFLFLRRRKQPDGSGFGWAVAGAVALLLVGFTFSRSRSRMEVTSPMPSALLQPNEYVIGKDESAQAAVARVQQNIQRMQEEVERMHDATSAEPLEALWNTFTQPKINLEAPGKTEAEATQHELANAAKVILAASAPGADPFTQGWLMNAAKAIMNAAPKGEANWVQAEIATPAAPGTPATPLKVVAVATPAAAVTVVQTPNKPRPDWIDNPPKLAGDTRRVVVSTDPLKTTEECHAQLEKRLRFAVASRVRELAKQATGRSAVNSPMLADMGISPDFILRELCPEGAYVEAANSSTGEMKRAHALVEFTPQKDEILLQRWQSATGTPGSRPVVAEAAPRAKSYTTGERPDWLEQPPKLVGNTRRVVVSTDPYVSVEECHAALQEKLRGVVQTRVDELVRAANGGSYANTPGLDSMGIGIEYILSELCPEDDYIETINTSVGEMKRAYALVEFNDSQDRFLLDRWRAYARLHGIEIIAVLSAFVVGGLAFVYGLLKVDTWTRGYYTKRLFLGVPAAIIAVGVVFVFLVENFH